MSLQNPQSSQVVPTKSLCRDMELTLMNELAYHAFSLIELHEHLNSSNFPGSFATIEKSNSGIRHSQ